MPTLIQQLRAAEAALAGPGRFRDLRLALTGASGEKLLVAGGRWFSAGGRFLDPVTEGRAESQIVIEQQESQLEFIRWAAEWLCDFREGMRREVQLAMLAGDRRGGKTFAAIEVSIAACVDVPRLPDASPLYAAIVAKSFRERFEIEEWIKSRIPISTREKPRKDAWARHHGAPEHLFEFVHGPILRMLSADDPDSLKAGRFDIVFVNEPQKVAARAVANVVMATADKGGLVILAANPPSNSRGEWMFDLKEAIDDECVALAQGKPIEPLGVKYFHVDSKKNKAIDQIARRRAGRIAVVIDPTIAAGDVEGSWRRPVERALWEFDKHRHLHAEPTLAPGLIDVTHEIACERGEWARSGCRWRYVAGVDFDWRPHIVAVIYRIFGSLDEPLFWARDEFAGEKQWTVKKWIEAFSEWGEDRGYTPDSLLLIGDASSSWPHEDDPKAGDRTAFETIADAGWTIIPPQDHRGKTGRARNPNVDERLDLTNEHLRRDRLLIDPIRCAWLAECAREASTERKTGRRRLVHNKYAHAVDAGTYPIWRLAPRGVVDRGSSGPPMITIPVRRFGDDF